MPNERRIGADVESEALGISGAPDNAPEVTYEDLIKTQGDVRKQLYALEQELEASYVVERLGRSPQAALSAAVMPRLRGGIRVPYPQSFQVLASATYFGGTEFTLGWIDPPEIEKIDHYEIYATNFLDENPQPSRVGAALASPAKVRIVASAAGPVVFHIQTVTKSGFTNDLGTCPTCTGTTISPAVDVTDLGPGTAGQLITWSAAGAPTTIGPGATGSVLTGNGAGAEPSFEDLTALLAAEGVIFNRVATTKNATFNVTSAADIYWVDASGGDVTANLPALSGWNTTVTIKKIDSSANLVIIDGNSTEQVEGDTTLTISYEGTSVDLFPDSGAGTWRVI